VSSAEPIAFAGGALDRAGVRRTDDAWLDGAWADAAALAVVIGREGVSRELVPLAPGDVGRSAEALFLGVQACGAPVWAIEREGVALTGLRDLAASLPAEQLGTIAYASALANWARATRFCGICGLATEPREAGHVRACANGHQHHPRTDPVVIMLVTDGDRALLGRQATWPPGRYSALAGFVEPGEDLETAVAREVLEESGIAVRDVRYVASQPWPFPVSLMLGFHAEYASGEISRGDEELEDVAWFTRAEIAAAASGDSSTWIDGAPSDGLLLPPSTAIARHLVDVWVGQG
jgi:NAD+ diphosphatase